MSKTPSYGTSQHEGWLKRSGGTSMQEFLQAQQEYRDRIKQIEDRLYSRRCDKVVRLLERLDGSGAKRYKVLRGVAQDIASKGRKWPAARRNMVRTANRTADRLHAFADELEKLCSNPALYCDLWILAAQQVAEPEPPPGCRPAPAPTVAERIPYPLFDAMRHYADWLHENARLLGEFSREDAPRVARSHVVNLIRYIHCATGDATKHLGTLAELLEAAYTECGIKTKPPTRDALMKMFERHVKT